MPTHDLCSRLKCVDDVLTTILPVLKPGDIILDSTTGDPMLEVAWSERLAERVRLIDATVLGSSQQMRQREAVMIIGGTEGDIESCRDIVEALVPTYFHVGPCGSGRA
ncbi:MAG: NAD(P)-binding domain-containing protein [Pirellulaceae bacterium]